MVLWVWFEPFCKVNLEKSSTCVVFETKFCYAYRVRKQLLYFIKRLWNVGSSGNDPFVLVLRNEKGLLGSFLRNPFSPLTDVPCLVMSELRYVKHIPRKKLLLLMLKEAQAHLFLTWCGFIILWPLADIVDATVFHRTIKDCNVFGVLFIYSVYVFWRSFWKCFPRKKKIARFFSHIEIRRWTILQMSFYLGCWVIKESERRNKWHQRLILSLLEFSLSLSYHES